MSWTYSGDPSVSELDRVRFLIGDTDDTDEQLQDEEIEWLISENSSAYDAAIAGAEAIAAKYARQVTKSVGPFSVSAEQRMRHYRDLAAELRARRNEQAPIASVYIGNDKDRRLFKIGMHDHDKD